MSFLRGMIMITCKGEFAFIKEFMEACDQTTDIENPDQAELYADLIDEELEEWSEARDEVEEFDAVLDSIWVLIGYGYSRGWPMEAGLREVARSNMSKCVDGKVIKDEDGKVLKPTDYFPPDLRRVLDVAHSRTH